MALDAIIQFVDLIYCFFFLQGRQLWEPKVKMIKCRKFTDAEYEILISAVQSRTCLWNDNHEDFKVTSVTTDLWNEVGSILNVPGCEAKKKWKNLKDIYRRILKLSLAKSGSAAIPERQKWRFFDLMHFTMDVVTSGFVLGNHSPTVPGHEVEESGDDLTDIQDYDFVEDIQHRSNDAQRAETPSQRVSYGSCSRPHLDESEFMTKQDFEKKMLELEEKKIDAILNLRKNSDNKYEDNDGDYHFMMSLLPFIQRLEPLEKLEARVKLQSVVLEVCRKHELKRTN